jgi:flagellar hook assembly protein FlgD
MYILNGSSSAITYNKITNNTYGIYLYPSLSYTLNPGINSNSIYGNTTYDAYASGHQNFSTMTINFENNWWGTTNLAAIAGKIYDRNDNANSPLLDIDPITATSSAITISGISVAPMFFTPPSGQTATINYTLDKPGNVTIRIYDFSPNQLVRTLINDQPRAVGANAEVWDGRNDLGQYLPKDVYTYTISVSDAAGQYGEYAPVYVSGSVQLQNPGVLPASFDAYKGQVASANYGLLSPAWVTLKVGTPGLLSPLRIMFVNDPRETVGNQDIWDGRDNSGQIALPNTYSIYAWTTILPDNAIIIRPDANLKINTLTSNPYAIYPGYSGITTLEYTIPASGIVSAEVQDPNGAPVRQLLTNQPKIPGTYTITWDGMDDTGRTVFSTGEYKINLTLTDASGFTTRTRLINTMVFK